MTIKSILVHVEDEENCLAKLESAFSLAKHFDAMLTAIFIRPVGNENIIPTLAYSPEAVGCLFPQEITYEISPDKSKSLSRVVNHLANVAQKTQRKFKFMSETGELKHILTETSRCFDLLVVSSDLDNNHGISKLSPLTNIIATESGCPLLIIPSQSQQAYQFKHPLIAWNGTPESARAISDSIPILANANHVSLVNAQMKHTSFYAKENYSEDLINYLQHHQVDAELVELKNQSKEALNKRVSQVIMEKKNDLLVLGAYGHSQLRELFFSSQTKELLNGIDVPVLLSH